MDRERGSVLLLSLWATATLAAVGVLQATRLSLELKWWDRFQQKEEALYLARTAVELAAARIAKDDPSFDAPKEPWGQQPKDPIPFGKGALAVTIQDEQALIPINAASSEILARLPGFTPASAAELIARREQGKRIAHLAELATLAGFNSQRLQELAGLVTLYGTGPVNLNSAPKEVLTALGFSQAFANRVAQYRAGADGVLGTKDDGVFSDAQQLQASLESAAGPISPEDQQVLSTLLAAGQLGIRSSYFRVEAEGRTERHGILKKAVVILERGAPSSPSRIRGWHEPR